MKYLLCLTLLLIAACGGSRKFSESRYLMGNEVTIILYAKNEVAAYRAFDAAFGEINRVAFNMDSRVEGSELFRLNHSSTEWTIVSPELFSLVEDSVAVSKATEGAYDITFPAIGKVWKLHDKNFVPPSSVAIRNALSITGYSYIQFDRTRSALRFSKAGVTIGLGGVGEGYAIAKGLIKLRECGITSGLIEAGGDVVALGRNGERRWESGIQNPSAKGAILGIALESGESVATSGDYEDFAVYNGKRYSHIIDARTGYPSQGLTSLTLLSDDPEWADAYATALFAMGSEAIKFCIKKRYRAVIIDSSGTILIAKELAGRILNPGSVPIQWY